MPNPRPLSSLRFGSYDQPPATTFDSNSPDRPVSRAGPPPPPPRAPSPSRSSQRPPSGRQSSDMTDESLDPRQQTVPGQHRRRRLSGIQDGVEMAGVPLRAGNLDFSAVELESMARNLKRRRVQGPPAPAPIRYGHFGQVEPGRLKLNLVSCDGGEHMDPRYPGTFLGPQNVLRHDKSVYCSERSRASLVLHHADDSPFCLEKLYIVGPDNGFTAPVREGSVYVSMTFDHLRPHLDQSNPVRQPGARSTSYSRPDRERPPTGERLSFVEALHDPEIDATIGRGEPDDSRIRTRSTSPDGPGTWRSHYDRLHRRHRRRSLHPPNCDVPLSPDSSDVVTSVDRTGRLFTVVPDAEPGIEDSSPQEVLDFRAERTRAMYRRSYFARGPGLGSGPPRTHVSGQRGLARLLSQHTTTDYESLLSDRDAAAPAGGVDNDDNNGGDSAGAESEDEGPVRGAEEEDLTADDAEVAAARFRIRHGKYKVAIHFDPPVSGRFILLKLWAGQSNVDVQSVVATGYGGCRFFPAVQMK